MPESGVAGDRSMKFFSSPAPPIPTWPDDGGQLVIDKHPQSSTSHSQSSFGAQLTLQYRGGGGGGGGG